MNGYRISYLLTTYNKLPYLQQVLGRLVAARQPDEEIVVADGGSKDGTPEYLRGLFEAGHIQQLVSERDKGESHGFNKCMLMARGELLKIITDDDAFYYPAIRQAADFMMAHPQVDVLSGNTGLVFLEDLTKMKLYEYSRVNFLNWYQHGTVGSMIGLPLIIRRTSLALTGLFHTGAVQMDTEFTYRITSLNVNIAWSSAMLSVRLDNPQSNFRNFGPQASQDESDRMRYYYDKQFGNDVVSLLRQRVPYGEWLKKPVRPAKQAVFRLLNIKQWEGDPAMPTNYAAVPGEPALAAAFRVADESMAQYNAQHPTEFISKGDLQPIAKAMPPTL